MSQPARVPAAASEISSGNRARAGRLVRRIRSIRLFWKLLVPFLLLMIVMGVLGAFIIVRDLSLRAHATLDQELGRRSVNVQAFFRDRELYLLESVRHAANLEGMPEAAAARDSNRVGELIEGVLALKDSLNALVVLDRDGTTIVEMRRRSDRTVEVSRIGGRRWSDALFVTEVLREVSDRSGDKRTGFLRIGDAMILATAGPIRTQRVVGVAIAGVSVEAIASEAAELARAGVSVHGPDGALLASAGRAATRAQPPSIVGDRPVRRTESRNGNKIAAVYAPLEIRGVRAGTFAVALPQDPVVDSVRHTGRRLALILGLAMAAVIALGSLLSRFILAQVAPLVETNRALGRGDLGARAPVLGADELGELAAGLNQMADQLQASYAELERRVEQRTEELRRLYEEVKRGSEARSEFFAAMSHEFRTPLFAILGHAEMMLDPEFAPKKKSWRAEFGQTIKESGEHLLGLVNDILDLAKFEAGRMEVTLEEVRLGDIIEEIQATIHPLARRSDLGLDIDIPPDLPMLRADHRRLREIVLNLMSNAIKYTPPGGRLGVEATEGEDIVEISVWDTGVGIPEEATPRIFEPFFQVKGTHAQRGEASSGLGLALTKRLVEAHGGRIWFESAPERGTRFSFTIPVAARRRTRGRRGSRQAEAAAARKGAS